MNYKKKLVRNGKYYDKLHIDILEYEFNGDYFLLF